MEKVKGILFNTTLYKIMCICALILTPSFLLCFFPQVVSIVLLVWGAVILLRDLITNRNFCKQTGSIFLLLFCLGYIVTLILYAENDLVSTLHVFCWAIVEFFLLFAIDREKMTTKEALMQDMYKINIAVSAVTLGAGAISLGLFFTKTSIIMPDPEGLNNFWSMGIINGRNSGIFNNAIPCANAMFVGFAASLHNLVVQRKASALNRVFHGSACVVAFLVILTTLTRTYIYGIYFFLFVAGFYGAYQLGLKAEKGKVKLFVMACAAAIAVAGIGFAAAEGAKLGMAKLIDNVPLNSVILNAQGFENPNSDKILQGTESIESTLGTETSETTTVEDALQKEYIISHFGLEGDVTLEREELKRLPNFLYPRDEMWKVALQVIPHSPIFGFTSGNRESTSIEFAPTGYRANGWPTGIPTYHNAYFDIAVSAGLLGLGLMLVFLVVQIARTLRVLFTKQLRVDDDRKLLGMGAMVGYLATHVIITSMFLGVLCFTNMSVCIFFWITLGYVSRINDLELQDKEGRGLLERLLKRINRK